jgi:hypothetical protein
MFETSSCGRFSPIEESVRNRIISAPAPFLGSRLYVEQTRNEQGIVDSAT